MFILVWNMRQNQEFHKSRSVMQALLSQKGAEEKTITEAFDALREAFFPFDRNEKKSQLKEAREKLMAEINRGPLGITMVEDPNRRKMSSRLVQGQANLAQKNAMAQSGASVALDPFDKARKRKRNA